MQQLYTHLIAYAPNNQPPSPFLLLSRTHASLSSACVYTHTHVCVCVCAYTRACVNIHIDTHSLTHTHTAPPPPSLTLSLSPSLPLSCLCICPSLTHPTPVAMSRHTSTHAPGAQLCLWQTQTKATTRETLTKPITHTHAEQVVDSLGDTTLSRSLSLSLSLSLYIYIYSTLLLSHPPILVSCTFSLVHPTLNACVHTRTKQRER